MADESSWSAVASELMQRFVVMRDLVGYMGTGLTFLMVGAVLSKGLFRQPSGLGEYLVWGAAAYVIGHIIAAATYFKKNCASVWKDFAGKKHASHGMVDGSSVAPPAERMSGVRDANYLYYHELYPQIFIEYDRQRIMALLRRGICGALVAGIFVFLPLRLWNWNASGAQGNVRASLILEIFDFSVAAWVVFMAVWSAEPHLKAMEAAAVGAAESMRQGIPSEKQKVEAAGVGK